MSETEREGLEASAAVAGYVDLATRTLGEMTPVRSARLWQTMRARLGAAEDARNRGRRLGLLLVGGVAAAAGAALVLEVRPGGAALAVAVDGGEVREGGYIRAADPLGTVKVRFSDGSAVTFEPHARSRLTSVGANGARIAIEEGAAEVRVRRRPDARWLFDAGPFLVDVKGTSFVLRWSPSREILDLDLRSGAVLVTGPLAERGIELGAGQRLAIRLRDRQVALSGAGNAVGDGEPVSGADPPEAEAGPAADLPAAPAARAARPAPASDRRAAAWAGWLASGDLAAILADAERLGLERVLATAPSADLAALADAARYSRRDDVARPALMAMRRRFPVGVGARDAAFFLAGLDEARAQRGEDALRWYDRYLAEAPAGSYAGEALGRKMVLVRKLRGEEAARPVAAAYLDRFPRGSYAEAARAIAAP